MENTISSRTLAAHYKKVLANDKIFDLGLLNAAENPVPRHVRFIHDELAPELCDGFKGFDTPLPGFIEGCTVLVLGCGTGRDAFIAAKLVGSKGKVIALDPSASAIKKANSFVDKQTKLFGYSQPNIEFVQGYPEDLAAARITSGSIDVVVTNFLLNLALDKEQVVKEAYRVLRSGGELYLGALFSNRRITRPLLDNPLVTDPVVRGAIYLEDFRRWLKQAGWENFRYIHKRRAVIKDTLEKETLKDVDLIFRVIRTFKLDTLEDLCENYGQSVEYLGTIPGYNQFFDLDDKHRFFIDKPARVCGNTFALIDSTRFAPYFRVKGSRNEGHFGLYDYCWYCGIGKPEDDIIEYLTEEVAVCTDCQHKSFCVVDGHCGTEE
ncbi:methyltransferase [Actinomycetota bacterium]|nr:methyltransferase [Actinomycetota bacterium]